MTAVRSTPLVTPFRLKRAHILGLLCTVNGTLDCRKRKSRFYFGKNSTITFNSAFNFTITAEEALGNWTLNTISVSSLFTRPEHTEAWRTFPAFHTNGIRR